MPLLKKKKTLKKMLAELPQTEPQERLSEYEVAKREFVSREKSRYDEVMRIAGLWLNGEYGQREEAKIDILDYLINVLLEELCSCGAVDPLINSQNVLYNNGYPSPFPLEYRNKNGDFVKIYGDKKTEVDLATTRIYVHPWDNGRTVRSLFLLKDKKFVYEEGNHISYYFEDLDFCYVYNGNHSINVGRYMKKGKIMSFTCDMRLLYSQIRTDGIRWYHDDNGTVIRQNVGDYRLAAIFTFGQMRHRLRTAGQTCVPESGTHG